MGPRIWDINSMDNNMTGSEKQITWAKEIKARVERWIARAVVEVGPEKEKPIVDMMSKVLDQTDAKFWIDNLSGVAEINEELTHTFSSGGAWEIKNGAWQKELTPVVKLNQSL